MSLDLTKSVEFIGQVGKATASRLKKLGIQNVKDLIFYYPFRYEDFSQVSSIADLRPFAAVTVKGKIEMIQNRRSWQKRRFLTEAIVSDDTGSIKVVWFNQPYLTKTLAPGENVYLAGKVSFDHYTIQLMNPIYEKVKAFGDTIHTARIIPIYSLTEGLTQKQLRWLIKLALSQAPNIADWLPPALRQRLDLNQLTKALEQIHFPDNETKLEAAVKRLKFDELFLFLLQSQLVKKDLRSAKAFSVNFNEKETKEFVASLPFTLTAEQKKTAWQILQDLAQCRPMNRLLEGEVGSGKTVVAAISIYNVALNGYQSVLMAPTEILARQHFENFKKLFANLEGQPAANKPKIRVAILTANNKEINGQSSTKARILQQSSAGNIDLIIGTQALIQQAITFNNLALVVIDEQHRFGVEQRKILHQKGQVDDLSPHFLSMTATPIPRSLALTLYGDLDLSIIRQLPLDRKKVITKIIGPAQQKDGYDFIRQQVAAGRQAFVICPLIDPSDKLGVKSVTEEAKRLQEQVFPDFKIALLHGKLKSSEKEKVMAEFLANQSQVLVATAVVEVGIDVPNATVMLIEGSQRFGLAQLYQFRGRVGRGKYQSYCFLATDSPQPKTLARLQALIQAKDAFELAELDLELRGPGEIFGTNQSGWPEFRIASLLDLPLVNLAKAEAERIIATDSKLIGQPLLREKIEELNKPIHFE